MAAWARGLGEVGLAGAAGPGDDQVLGPADPFEGGQGVLGGGGDRGLIRPPGGERLAGRESGGLAARAAGGGVAAGDFLGQQDPQHLGGVPPLGAGGGQHLGRGVAQVRQTHPPHQGFQLGRDRRRSRAGHRDTIPASPRAAQLLVPGCAECFSSAVTTSPAAPDTAR